MIRRLRVFFLVQLFSAWAMTVEAQDLVPNGDFEAYNKCPYALAGIDYSPTYSSFSYVKDWVRPTVTTSDYFNKCAKGAPAAVPNNIFGFQMPHSGAGYAGFYAYEGPKDYREYLTTKLLSPMVRDSTYCVRFYVSPGWINNQRMVAVKRIGIHFSDNMPFFPAMHHDPILDLEYHIQSDTNRAMTDTSRWYEIRGSYKAIGGETWLTIGTFGHDTPSYTHFSGPTTGNILGYYYIDDVSVNPLVTHDSTYSVLLCDSSLLLNPARPVSSSAWSTGDTGAFLTVTKPGTYTRVSYQDCQMFTDRFEVVVPPRFDTTYPEIPFCDRAAGILISSALPAGPYLWNTGDSTRSIRVSAPGNYTCEARYNCRLVQERFKIVEGTADAPDIKDASFCQYSPSPRLPVGDTGIIWYMTATDSTGSHMQPQIATGQTGTIRLYAARRSGDCVSPRVPVAITILPQPVSGGSKQALRCEDGTRQQVVLGTDRDPGMTYTWNTGDSLCCITPEADGVYFRIAGNACGSAVDTFLLRSRGCDSCISVPSAFSPNNDSRNDRFRALVNCPVSEFRMRIFNRWGEEVFVTEQSSGYWDGRLKGQPAPAGTYMYFISYSTGLSARKYQNKGSVTLLR